MILVGAEDPLPSNHFWFDGEGFSIYTAKQPRSTWSEHVHDCVQITVGLEPAHIHAEWRAGGKLRQHKEFIGNAVSVIPAGEPHRTLWQRRADLIHIYLGRELLCDYSRQVLHQDSFELSPNYLVRDLLIEELARALYLECETNTLNDVFAKSVIAVLSVHLLRSYGIRPDSIGYFQGGLGPARERRIREYIEKDLERDLSIQALALVVGLSPQHFAVLFRDSTGFTPHQYVNHRRVERAQRLLADRAMSLVEISMACGFSSQSQFITLFRRLVGMTPGKFRSELPCIDNKPAISTINDRLRTSRAPLMPGGTSDS
ncbi:helix-turn-helix transcriptional regulator [Edaphobacter sp. HDX4]|uniref:helix-turn-helix transcriptional regulator n=1 Tax=Edaphobacter sp. HDX4 TaxID=2794064 RepID=UPI002FE6519C